MSLRRILLMLIASAFLGSCVILYQLNSNDTDHLEVWVSLNAGEPCSLAEVSLAEVPTRQPDPPLELEQQQAPATAPTVLANPVLPAPVQSELKSRQAEPPLLTRLPAILLPEKSAETIALRTRTESLSRPTESIAAQPTAEPNPQRIAPATANTDARDSSAFQPSSAPILNPFFKPHAPPQPTGSPALPPRPKSSEGHAGPVSSVQQPSGQQPTEQQLKNSSYSARTDADFVPLHRAPSADSADQPFARPSTSGADVQTAENESTDVRQAWANDHPSSTVPASLTAHSTPSPIPNQTGITPVGLPAVLQNAQNFVLAEQPQAGAHWKNETPITDPRAVLIEPMRDDFSPGPAQDCLPYIPEDQQQIYEGKTLNANQRPLLEIGRPWYQLGQLSPGSNRLGKHNPLEQQFIIFGDARSGFASNTQAGNSSTLSASQLNLNFDWKLTSTERLHMFVSPLTKGLDSTGFLFDEDRFLNNTNANIPFGYFEGDLGAMVGGLTNQTYPFDLPFAIGVLPMLFQNGVWMEDTMLGVAFTIPSRNSARFDISNMDLTFFAGFDQLVTDALPGDDSAGKVYGIASFLEAWNGYVEADYAFLEDRSFLDRSYHNFGLGYTRRYGRFVSNSTRVFVNLGQDPKGIDQTADGWLLLSENSLITAAPSTIVPYLNLFAGFDRPQSVARNGLAGGVLRNTGILFESDNLTRYPTLDATAHDTYGAALGLNLLASDFSQQLVLETAFVGTLGSDLGRTAVGNQYGWGARYQLPLTNSMIFRADLMYGFLESSEDSHGARVELRHKF